MRSSGLIKRNFRYPKDVRIAEINGKSDLTCLKSMSRFGGTFFVCVTRDTKLYNIKNASKVSNPSSTHSIHFFYVAEIHLKQLLVQRSSLVQINRGPELHKNPFL